MFGFISGIKTFSTDYTTSFDTSFTTTYNTSHVTTYNTSHVTTYNTSHVTTYNTSRTTTWTTSFATGFPVAAYAYGGWSSPLLSYDPPVYYYRVYGAQNAYGTAKRINWATNYFSPYFYSYYGHFGNYEYGPGNFHKRIASYYNYTISRRTKTLYYYTGYTTTSRSTSRTTTFATSRTTTYATSHTTTYATSHTTTYSTSHTTTVTTSNTTSRTTNFYSSV